MVDEGPRRRIGHLELVTTLKLHKKSRSISGQLKLILVATNRFTRWRDHIVIDFGWFVYCKSVTKLWKSSGGWLGGEGVMGVEAVSLPFNFCY